MSREVCFARITDADVAIAQLVLAGVTFALLGLAVAFVLLRVAEQLGELDGFKRWLRELRAR